MTHINKKSLQNIAPDKEAGFTLVELAVVMIIIGLLIGGILKGQELISNAEVSSTTRTIETIDSASIGFTDAYGSVPGDILNATVRIPNCAAAPCEPAGALAGGEVIADGVVGVATAANDPFGGAPTAEQSAYFLQLYQTDFIGGIDPAGGAVFGGIFPGVDVGSNGGLMLGYLDGSLAAITNSQTDGVTPFRRGHWMSLSNAPNAATPATGFIEESVAARIDRKLDDGDPDTGDVRAAGAAACVAAAAGNSIYNEANRTPSCSLYLLTSF